jgi:nitroreductase
MDALEAIRTCTAMRYLKPDPVPEPLIRQVLEHAACASSPGNSQGWDFVVVRDATRRAAIGKLVAEKFQAFLPDPASEPDPVRQRMLRGARHLVQHLGHAPVLIFVCGRPVYPPQAPSRDWIPSTVYPAAQNLIVAARALGLGTVFTAFHGVAEQQIGELLALPADARIYVTIPLGWPQRRFAPVRRRPVQEVTHWERW